MTDKESRFVMGKEEMHAMMATRKPAKPDELPKPTKKSPPKKDDKE